MDDRGQATICCICLEDYADPKLLPCFHTFCRGCLEQHAGRTTVQGHFLCPQCRERTKIPLNGIQGFQTNFYITSFQEKNGQSPLPTPTPPTPPATEVKYLNMCAFCNKGQARFDCKTCHKLLCNRCNKNHKKPKATRNHHVVLISENIFCHPAEEMICSKHKSHAHRGKQVCFCIQCNVPICMSCKMSTHEGHSTEDLQDRLNKVKENLRDFSFEAQRLSHEMEDLKAEGVKMENQSQVQAVEVMEHIENDREKVVSIINSQSKQLVRQVKRKSDAALESIYKHISSVVDHDEQLEEIKAVIKDALTLGSFQAMQTASKTVEEALQCIKRNRPGKMKCLHEIDYDVSGFHQTRIALISNTLGRLRTNELVEGGLSMPQGTQILATFNVPCHSRPNSIIASKEGIMISYHPSSGLVHLFSLNGSLKNSLKAQYDIGAFTADESGEVCAATTSRKCICTVLTNEQDFQPIFEDLPLPPGAIASNKVHFFVVGSTKAMAAGILQICKDSGIVMWIFKDENGIVFKKPSDIAFWSKGQTVTTSMLIVTDPKAHRVVFLSLHGQTYHITKIYSGEGLHKEVEKFRPEGVCVDKLGNIFIADSASQAVIQLSKKGSLMEDQTIVFSHGFSPRCLTSTDDGKLVVASSEGTIKVIKRANP